MDSNTQIGVNALMSFSIGQVSEKLVVGDGKTAEEIARSIDADPEDLFHVLLHLASNDPHISVVPGEEQSEDRFSVEQER
jgi:hypothetical protein